MFLPFEGGRANLSYTQLDPDDGPSAQIVAAIVAFAILGKATDWMIAAISAPFLRWEDRFARS